MENLYQAEQKLRTAQDAEATAARKVEIAQARLTEVKKTAAAGSSQLLAAEDKLATAHGKLNTASAKTAAATGSLSNLHKEAATAATTHATAVGKVETAHTKASGAAGQFGKAVGAMAGALGLANLASEAGTAVVDFVKDSVGAAIGLQQAGVAAKTVFGSDFPAIAAAADGAALSVGLASGEYEKLATVLGAKLKVQGVQDVAGDTQKLIGIGADLAQQFGGSSQDAVAALSKAMTGQGREAQKYGLIIKETGVSAILAANGQDKLTGEALTQAQAQARLTLIMQQTTDSQGAFARGADTAVGSQARLSAQVGNFQEKLGTALLPALAGVTSYMSQTMEGGTGLSKVLQVVGNVITSYVSPIITKVQEGFANFKASIDKVTGGSAQTEAMLQKVGEVVGKVAGFIGNLVGNQLSLFLTGLGKVIEVTKIVVDWIGRMSDKIGNITLPFGLGKISDVVGDISRKLEAAVGWIGRFLDTGNANAIANMAGLFRSDMLFGGGGTGWSRIPLLVPAPVTNVNVNVDGASLRGIIRAEIRASLPRGGGLR